MQGLLSDFGHCLKFNFKGLLRKSGQRVRASLPQLARDILPPACTQSLIRRGVLHSRARDASTSERSGMQGSGFVIAALVSPSVAGMLLATWA